MKTIPLLVVSIFASAVGQTLAREDRYPDVRLLLREAETAARGLEILSDRSDPHAMLGDLYAHAGYIDDAIRAFGKPAGSASEPHYGLWRAQVVYGQLSAAEASIGAIADPERRAGAMTALGDLLWRMGEPAEARIRFEAARRLTPGIANPEHRKRLEIAIGQDLALSTEEAPYRISPVPAPRPRFKVQDSPIPPFPITTDGFRDRNPRGNASRAAEDADFMTRIYGRMEAGDREGLLRLIESAPSPFQNALGLASIEHILIQAQQPEPAEQYARKIPESNSDCLLAKAEALSAVGAAWLRAGESARANAAFDAAIGLVNRVPELALGKVLVTISIAQNQIKGGMVASGGTTLRLSLQMAQALPRRPVPAKGTRLATPPGIHYQDEAYSKILPAAIRSHDLGAARQTAELWSRAEAKAETDIARAWLDADQLEEALAFTRKIADMEARVSALLWIARDLLNNAGAPVF